MSVLEKKLGRPYISAQVLVIHDELSIDDIFPNESKEGVRRL